MAKSSAPSGMRAFISSRTSKFGIKSLLRILVLLGACCASGWIYMRVMEVDEQTNIDLIREVSAPNQDVVAEQDDLTAVTKRYRDLSSVVRMSTQSALLAETSSRHPIGKLAALMAASPAYAAGGEGGAGEEMRQEYELDPPQIVVVAVMITNDSKTAMINVLGEDTGLVVKVGSTFSGGTARITNISEGGVTFTWMKKSYTVEM